MGTDAPVPDPDSSHAINRPVGLDNLQVVRQEALGDGQARAPLNATDASKLKGKRDRVILSILLYHGIRREDLAKLNVKDYNQTRAALRICESGAKAARRLCAQPSRYAHLNGRVPGSGAPHGLTRTRCYCGRSRTTCMATP